MYLNSKEELQNMPKGIKSTFTSWPSSLMQLLMQLCVEIVPDLLIIAVNRIVKPKRLCYAF